MATKTKPSAERDALRQQLAGLGASNNAPGAEQAKRALEKQQQGGSGAEPAELKPAPAPPKATPASAPSKPKAAAPKQPVKRAVKREDDGIVERVSVQLYPEDVAKLDEVADRLRQQGAGRQIPTAWLLRVALSACQTGKGNEQLLSAYDHIRDRTRRGQR